MPLFVKLAPNITSVENSGNIVEEIMLCLPFDYDPDIASRVLEIRADGEERNKIIRMFFEVTSNMGISAMPKAYVDLIDYEAAPRSLRWYGDVAKFIIGNLGDSIESVEKDRQEPEESLIEEPDNSPIQSIM